METAEPFALHGVTTRLLLLALLKHRVGLGLPLMREVVGYICSVIPSPVVQPQSICRTRRHVARFRGLSDLSTGSAVARPQGTVRSGRDKYVDSLSCLVYAAWL